MVTDEQLSLLQEYVSLLLQWNRKINLISRKDEGRVWIRHILHSISILIPLAFAHEARILDLGTGGGLPGIPMKVIVPSFSFTLVDSSRKKTLAVASILRELSLDDITVKCGRAEELAKEKEFRTEFDYVISRGVATLKKLIDWGFPFLRKSDSIRKTLGDDPLKTSVVPPALIAMKGGDLRAEIFDASKDERVREIREVDLLVKRLEELKSAERKAVIVYFK